MIPALSPVPPSVDPTASPEGIELERAARAAMLAAMHLVTTVRAPSWRQLLFHHSRIKFTIPTPPAVCLRAIERPQPEEFAPSAVGLAGLRLLEGLQKSKPVGITPRSLVARPALSPPRSAEAEWKRRVFLTTAGPEALSLLAAAGYLLAADIALVEEAYPEGLDEQRRLAVEAAMAYTTASRRNQQDANLPDWLNDQMLTLMSEPRETNFFQELYKSEPTKPHGPPTGGAKSVIASQMAPTPSPGGDSQ